MQFGRLRTSLVLLGAGAVLLLGAFQVGRAAGAAGADPGSAADPLVSKSYVDQYVQTYVGQYVQNNMQSLVSQSVEGAVQQAVVTQLPQALANSVPTYVAAAVPEQVQRSVGPYLQFQVVSVPKGQTLLGGASTEMILRSGDATAVVSDTGGLSDLTGGKDLGKGAKIPANHLLLIPRDDGRGMFANTNIVVMVRGPIQVQMP